MGPSGLLVAVSIGILAIFAPCQPLLVNSILCRDGGFLVGRKYLWIVHILSAMVEFVLCLSIVLTTIHYFMELMLKGFAFLWMTCEDFVKSYNKKLSKIGEYQNLRIFEKCLNSCTRSRIFLVAALGSPAAQILIGYMGIKLFRSTENEQFKASLFLWVCFNIFIFTMIMFSGAAQINNVSREWLEKCRWNAKSKLERKLRKSLAPLRLEFGNNFVERLTTLVAQEFCVRQMVSGLLLT